MTQNDDELVNFLKTYSPIPPQENNSCEELVMRSLKTTSVSFEQKCLTKRWLLPGILITILLIIGGYFGNVNSRSNPQLAIHDAEKLEAFMVETWYDSIATNQESELNFVTTNN